MAFPIKCSDCKKSFSISDDVYNRKVRGKLVTIKCKSCGAAIRVDGTKPAAESKAPPASAATEAEAAPAPETAVVQDIRDDHGGASRAATASSEAAQRPAATVHAAAGDTRSGGTRSRQPLISSPTKPAATRGALQQGALSSKPSSAAQRPTATEQKKDITPATVKQPAAPKAGALDNAPASRGVAAAKDAAVPATTPSLPQQASAKSQAATRSSGKPLTTNKAGAAGSPRGVAPKPAESSAGDDAILWAVDYGESEHRELTTAGIEAEIKRGNIDGQTLVWHDNMPDWLAILDVKELRGFVEAPSEVKAKPPPAPKSAPKSSPRAPGHGHGLPTVPQAAPPPPLGPLSSRQPATSKAPGLPKPAASRPPPPPKKSRPSGGDPDEVVTSARLIEDAAKEPTTTPFADLAGAGAPALGASFGSVNPSLGSPGAPPLPQTSSAVSPILVQPQTSGSAAAVLPPAFPAAPAAASPAASAPAQPLSQVAGMPASPPFGSPMAPPMAVQPPQLPMASSSLSDDIEWPQARSKKPLILGLVGVTAVVLIGWLLASGSSDEPSSPATTVEGATTPAAPVDVTPPQRPEPRPTEATPDGGSDEAAPSATTEPSPNKKSGDFADLFEQTAKGSR